jgi:hypothetical protein
MAKHEANDSKQQQGQQPTVDRTVADEKGCFHVVDECGCRVIDPCGCYTSRCGC